MSLRTLTEIADKQVSRSIQTVNGVGQVTIAGSRAREIHIVVDIEKLNSYGLSMAQVRDAVVAENVEIPGGAVEQGKGQLLLRTMGRIDAAEDFNNIVVATQERHADSRLGSRLRRGQLRAADLVGVVRRQAGGAARHPARDGREHGRGHRRRSRAAARRSSDRCPNRCALTVVRDDSKFIYASVASLEEHLIFGSLFAAIVVMFFIRNIRAVIIASLAIPASIISSFTLMRVMGFTLNNMTLLGITLAVGIVIDDAIVVLGEHLPLHRGEGRDAVRGGDSGDARSGAGGHGHDAVAGRDFPADRVHDRLCPALHQPVRPGRWRFRSWCRCSSASR